MSLRKRFLLLLTVIASIGLIVGCSQKEKDAAPETNQDSVLDEEMIQLFEKGQIKGIPFTAGEYLTMADVEKVWGKPDKIVDHEDIHDYVYERDGQYIVFTEDELGQVYYFKSLLDITIKDIYNALGKPDQGKKTSHVLVYYIGDYHVQFDYSNDEQWWLIIDEKRED